MWLGKLLSNNEEIVNVCFYAKCNNLIPNTTVAYPGTFGHIPTSAFLMGRLHESLNYV